MKTSNLIQDPPDAHASGPRGGMPSPSTNHDTNFALAGRGHSPRQRWRRRIPAPVVLAAVLGICGLTVRGDVVSEPLLKFGDPGKPFTAVAFTPDGRQVLSCVREQAVDPNTSEVTYRFSTVLWDLQTGLQVRVFQQGSLVEGDSVPVTVSPDGRWGLTASETNAARLWDLQTGEVIRTLTGHRNTISAVAFSPDGGRVLSGAWDGTAKLWEADTGLLLKTLSHNAGADVRAVGFLTDGQRVVAVPVCDSGVEVRVWDAGDGQLLHTFPEVRFDYWGEVPFCSDLRYVLGATNVWDTQTGQTVLAVGPDEGGSFEHYVVSPDGREVWSSVTDWLPGRLFRWDQETGWVWAGQTGSRLEMISPNGEWLLFNGERGPELWDRRTIRLLRTFEVEPSAWQWESDSITSWFSPDGQFVLAIGSDGISWVWDLRDRLAGLRTSRVAGRLELRWQLGTLQSAETVNGPWQDVTNAVSPLQADLVAGARFYRVKVGE